jgi:uncharacterized 2Fe-2S/4Fe-4S cluster protein (DUF4445 family)
MAAEPGAIHRISQMDSSGASHFEVLGGGEPAGICGSGFVDAIACLLADGALSPTGRFTRPVGAEGMPVVRGRTSIALRQHDIDVFQRAKSATAAGIACVLKRARIDPGDLRRICVCGTFGRFLHVARAQSVGLLPEVPVERVELHADAALHGCESLLLSGDTAAHLATLRENAKVINLAEDPEFEARFLEHLHFRRKCPA